MAGHNFSLAEDGGVTIDGNSDVVYYNYCIAVNSTDGASIRHEHLETIFLSKWLATQTCDFKPKHK